MRKPMPFGKYLLLDRIAVGGMAEVFAAKTFGVEGFERLVAIKRILPTMVEDDEFITMFIDEARIAAMLSHANLVQIYDLGKFEETFYIAMEYIAGRDVRLLIDKFKKRNETVPIPMAVFIMSRICEGLDYAHRKKDARGRDLGIIHRDISPQNVLVSYEGDVKIIDFGIAKAAGRIQKTQAGILKGKFGYMSPEQVRGIPIDHRSDIYSAGVMLYEMLTGTKLFTGESDFSTLEKVRAGDVPAPSEINPEIPPALERVVLKALAKERDERYQWGSDFHDDLVRFLYSGDGVYSTKTLANFMRDAFGEEQKKENERQRRWHTTQLEETSDFEALPSSPPVPAPAAALAAAASANGAGANGKVRMGPPSAFMTSELRLQDRTSVYEPFNAESAEGGRESRAPRSKPRNGPADDERSLAVTDAVSLAELGLSSQPTRVRSAADFADPTKDGVRRSNPVKGRPPIDGLADLDVNDVLDAVRRAKGGGSETPSGSPRVKANTGGDLQPAPRPKKKPTTGDVPPPPVDEPQAEETPAPPAPPPAAPAPGMSRATKIAIAALSLVIVAIVGVGAMRKLTARVAGVVIAVRPAKEAVVVVDGQRQAGAQPLSMRLPAGEHRLEVSAEGFEDHSETFTLGEQPLSLTVELKRLEPEDPEPAPEELAPPVEPAPEPVVVAPEKPEKTGPKPKIAKVDSGRPSGSKATIPPVTVVTPPPEPVVVVPKAEPKSTAPLAAGSFRIFSDPKGAIVAVDGKVYGKAPIAAEDLPGGKMVEVKLVLPGHKPLSMMQEVTPGRAEVLKLTLQPLDSAKAPAPTPAPTPVPTTKEAAAPAGSMAMLTAMCVPVAKVIVDGKDTSKWTPITAKDALELAPGKHTVLCETQTGVRSAPQDFQMEAGGRYSFRARIE